MIVRVSFLLLVALNLGAAAWLLFGRAAPESFPPPTDPGIPELHLVAEARPPRAGRAASVPGGAAGPRQHVCTTLGPFMTGADMRAALATLSPRVAHIQYREQEVRRSHGYWVYLPAAANREAALAEARALSAKGIHDFYVVTAGDSQNTVSLGLYNDRAHAQVRLVEVLKLGFTASMEQRLDTEPAYWVDFAVAPTATFDWQAWLPGRTDLHARLIDCPASG